MIVLEEKTKTVKSSGSEQLMLQTRHGPNCKAAEEEKGQSGYEPKVVGKAL